MRVLDHLLKSIRNAAVFNSEAQVRPACILWPDSEEQWAKIIPALQAELPELLVLGGYMPENRIGPAIWLRCALAGLVEDIALPENCPPILYLPGVSRQDLRAVETCPDHLKPLAELQYRGTFWSQINGKDWTVLAYFKSSQGGLGLDIAQDRDCRNALKSALYKLLDEEISSLRGRHLDKDYFHALLTGGDPIRDLLHWLDRGEEFKKSRGEVEWKAFVEVCKSQRFFHPDDEGILEGISRLASHEDSSWCVVWERYCEAPERYPNIEGRIRQCSPPKSSLKWLAPDDSMAGWPQWNDEQEKKLSSELQSLEKLTPNQAQSKILELEKKHAKRRNLVWTELGQSPLACSLGHLAFAAEKMAEKTLAAGSLEDLEMIYSNHGWKVDDAMIQALAYVEKAELKAVMTAIRSIYLPWLETSARYLQKRLDDALYPGGSHATAEMEVFQPGDCVLFVDGLRFDTAKGLARSLKQRGCEVLEDLVWAALPSVTATGKAAVTPVRDRIQGQDGSQDFEPSVADTGQSLKGGYHLKKLLTDAGWSILGHSDNGDGRGMAWCEFGDIDQEGHHRGWKLAKHIDILLQEINDRIAELLTAGWKRIRVVTDHGWLLLPGGLPKIDLPSVLTNSKWGRCASLKPGATSDERLYPWYWNPNQYFALADGVSCFKKGEEYAHGGLSLQECLTLQLTVSGSESTQAASPVEFSDIVWKGLRCTIAVVGNFSGLSLDVRSHAGNPSSSVVVGSKMLKDNGTASVVVEDEDMEGREATVVLVDANGSLIAQIPTIIGGGKS